MIRLGERQTLEIYKKVEFGVYLIDPEERDEEESILLPKKQVPESVDIGDEIEVFIYRDSKDRLIATTAVPKLMIGQVAELRVAQTGKIGAFLDWGLEKDLLLPFKEQTAEVQEGDTCLVTLYIDKSDRLCATMKIYHVLPSDSPYEVEDRVEGLVYEISDNFGAFVAVDNQYSALIPKKELYGSVKVGERIQARVVAVKEDGKLDLSIRERGMAQITEDAGKIMELLNSYAGVLPFSDKASPEVIKRETGMSKNQFKKAVGNLLKNGKIELQEGVIRKIK